MFLIIICILAILAGFGLYKTSQTPSKKEEKIEEKHTDSQETELIMGEDKKEETKEEKDNASSSTSTESKTDSKNNSSTSHPSTSSIEVEETPIVESTDDMPFESSNGVIELPFVPAE